MLWKWFSLTHIIWLIYENISSRHFVNQPKCCIAISSAKVSKIPMFCFQWTSRCYCFQGNLQQGCPWTIRTFRIRSRSCKNPFFCMEGEITCLNWFKKIKFFANIHFECFQQMNVLLRLEISASITLNNHDSASKIRRQVRMIRHVSTSKVRTALRAKKQNFVGGSQVPTTKNIVGEWSR